ncbi:MAG: magnesium transporter CorA [Lachnospiraceae bacterium]|nr:magnesium transporter CorA [Lachnospiraceae bacterium]
MIYLIEETLKEVSRKKLKNTDKQYVVVLSTEEWMEHKDSFEMGIDFDPGTAEIFTTKAEVNYDSLTGSFSIPDRTDFNNDDCKFAFALDEKGIVFIDDTGRVVEMINAIIKTKKWNLPSLERFIYDFLDQITKDDLRIMEKYECELDDIETKILNEEDGVSLGRVNDIRSDIRYLRIHYEQLMDLGQELEENENNFFKQENLRYFRLFLDRMARLHDTSTSLRDYTMQLRDLYKAHLDIKQNRIMTVLTVVTTIFLPLTLIAGWYGMNFRYMPELEWKWGYPVVIAVCVAIVGLSLLFFKKKKWL